MAVYHSSRDDWRAVHRRELLPLVWDGPHRWRANIRTLPALYDCHHRYLCRYLDDTAHALQNLYLKRIERNGRREPPTPRPVRFDDSEKYSSEHHHLDDVLEFPLLPAFRQITDSQLEEGGQHRDILHILLLGCLHHRYRHRRVYRADRSARERANPLSGANCTRRHGSRDDNRYFHVSEGDYVWHYQVGRNDRPVAVCPHSLGNYFYVADGFDGIRALRTSGGVAHFRCHAGHVAGCIHAASQ